MNWIVRSPMETWVVPDGPPIRETPHTDHTSMKNASGLGWCGEYSNIQVIFNK